MRVTKRAATAAVIIAASSWIVTGIPDDQAGAATPRPSTFVSGKGKDANTCTRRAPCRTFARALDVTTAGGVITVLDSGSYGELTITKSISITNDGAGSAVVIVPSGHNGITVAAGPTDIVDLRGLTVEGESQTTSGIGIRFEAGKLLTVEATVVRNVTEGILFVPTASGELAVTDSVVTDTGSRAIHVNLPSGATGAFKAVISRTEVHGGVIGIFAQGTGANLSSTIDMTVSDCVATGFSQDGMRANSLSGAQTTLTITRSVSSNNGTGISAANGDAVVRVGQSTVSGNASGWLASSGGTLVSYGDNNVNGNAADEGAITLVAKK